MIAARRPAERSRSNRKPRIFTERNKMVTKDIQLRELFRNTEKYADKEVTVRGWVRQNRNSTKFGFINPANA